MIAYTAPILHVTKSASKLRQPIVQTQDPFSPLTLRLLLHALLGVKTG